MLTQTPKSPRSFSRLVTITIALVATAFGLSVSARAGTETVLYDFNTTVGGYPSGLISDAAGNLYGTTEGGANKARTVFEVTP